MMLRALFTMSLLLASPLARATGPAVVAVVSGSVWPAAGLAPCRGRLAWRPPGRIDCGRNRLQPPQMLLFGGGGGPAAWVGRRNFLFAGRPRPGAAAGLAARLAPALSAPRMVDGDSAMRLHAQAIALRGSWNDADGARFWQLPSWSLGAISSLWPMDGGNEGGAALALVMAPVRWQMGRPAFHYSITLLRDLPGDQSWEVAHRPRLQVPVADNLYLVGEVALQLSPTHAQLQQHGVSLLLARDL